MSTNYRILYVSIIFTFLFISCSQYADNVDKTLKLAKENKKELVKVLQHYKKTNEKLKYEAACFLIGNMEFKYSYEQNFISNDDKSIYINYSKYPDTQSARKGIDSIRMLPNFKFEKTTVDPDYKKIQADYLIENIDQAFYLWKNVEWSKHLSFNQFCESVLPYRVLNEPLNNWRDKLYDKYGYLNDIFKDSTVSGICTYLNGGLNDSIVFWPAYSVSNNQQIVDSIFNTKKGKCPDLTILSTSALRAIGIPVLVDMCLYWGNSGFGHIWNRLIVEDGSTIRFNSIDKTKPPGKYPNDAKMPKVFRLTYKTQDDCLFYLIQNKEDIPKEFLKNNIIDVTHEYTNTGNIKIHLEVPPLQEEKYAYLCVFNYGEWKPVYWGKINKDSVQFTNMGKNILYMPMYYRNKTFLPAGSPFIFNDIKNLTFLNPIYTDSIIAFKNYSTRVGDSKKFLKFNREENLTVKYWDGKWKKLNGYKIVDSLLLSKTIPKNCLYIIEPENPDFYFIRPFIIKNGQQVYF